jgi:hypothetical protein
MNKNEIKSAMEDVDIQPNKACWILGNGRVADVSLEGWNDDETAFSHGIFVKQWVKFRTRNFCPDKAESELAMTIERRAKELLATLPELRTELDDESDTNPFEGDLAYVHAAEEQGWIRVKPLPYPVLDNSVYMETVSPDLIPCVAQILDDARNSGLNVKLLTGGAIVNRGVWVQTQISINENFK